MEKEYLFKNISKLLFSLFFLFNIFLFNINDNVYAGTVRINRPKVRLRLSAGGSESSSIRVSNPSGDRIAVKVYLEDWVYAKSQDGVKNFALPGTTPLSCAKWISFYPAEFIMSPYGAQEVFYTVKAPQGIEGGYYAVLFFETMIGATESAQGVNIAIKGRIGSLFYVEVGSTNKQVILTDLSIIKKGRGFRVGAVLKNVGNVDVTAKGTFNILDNQGMVFARGEFNDVYTFPGEQGKISSTWPDTIPAGTYDLLITLDLGDMPLIEEAQISISPSGEVTHVSLKE